MKQSTNFILFYLFLTFSTWASFTSAQTEPDILATVNGETISQVDVDNFLSLSPQADRSGEATKNALTQLVNNRLLVQSYFEESDLTEAEIKTLASIQALNGIAQLQIRKIAENIQRSVTISDPRIQSIIQDNSAAFEDRKLVTFMETNEFSAPDEFWKSLPPLKTLEDVVEQARVSQIDFTQQIVSVYSNTIQPSFRDVLLAAKPEDVLVFKQSNSDRGRLFVVKQVYDAPVTGAAAEAVAQDILIQALQRQAIDNFLKEKTASSIITYSSSVSQLDDLPVGTTEEAIQARKLYFYYFVAGLAFLGLWGAITHVMITRCWTGRFYIPFSAWFSENARKVKFRLDTGTLSISAIEKSLGGGGKAAVFFISSLGWIFYIILVAVAAREDYRIVLPITLISIIAGLGLTAVIATTNFLDATSKRRVLVMNVAMSVFLSGAVTIAYFYYRYIGFV